MQTINQIAAEVLKIEANELLRHAKTEIEDAVNLIFNTKGKVIVTGVGKSGHVGAKIAATLASTGTRLFCIQQRLCMVTLVKRAHENDLTWFVPEVTVVAATG